MLKLQDNPTFTHDVTAHMPVDGGTSPQTFKATYKLLTGEELSAFDTTTPPGMQAFLQAAVVGVSDIQDDQGQPIPYSNDLRDRLIDIPPIMNALFNAYVSACAGARAGN